MKVVVTRDRLVELQGSLVNEDGPLVDGQVAVTGVGLFDSEERLVPLASEYLSYAIRHKKLADTSAQTYGQNIGYSLDWFKTQPNFASASYDEILLAVTKNTIWRYFAYLREVEGLSSTTIRNRDSCLMALYSDFLCVASKHKPARRQDNPYAGGFISPTPKRELVIPCSLQDLKHLIKSTPYERERAVIQFIFDSGLRRSEVGRVTLGAVNHALNFARSQFYSDDIEEALPPEYCPLTIDGSKGPGGEYKPRISIVSRATLERIRAYHSTPLYRKYARQYESPEHTPCFFNADGKPYNADAVSKLLERLSERAVKKKLIDRSISPHKLRHGNAYAILSSPDLGKDYLGRLAVAQRHLGHSRDKITEIYTQIPHEIFSLLSPDGEVTTRAKNMQDLSAETTLKIRLGDMK